jgi:uncharacterized protein (TIGR03067 family)
MRAILLILAVFVVGFAPAPFPRRSKAEPEKDDLKKMQGLWHCVRRTLAGNPSSRGDVTVEIAGSRFRYRVDGRVTTEWQVTLDASKKPKVLDRERVAAATRGSIVLRGIYRLEGDTLTVCYHQGRTEGRPADFDGTGAGIWLMVLKRARP